MRKNTFMVTLAALTLALGVGGGYAYYTAQTNTAKNSFNIVAGGSGSGDTVGTIDEVFNPTTSKDVEPRGTFAKEASLTSKVDYSSYAYLYVTVPNINAKKGAETAKTYQDAVTLNFDTAKWDLVKTTAGSASAPTKFLYRYKTVLDAGASTTNLFTQATVPDFTESDALSGTIDVTGYMLSSTNVEKTEADAAAIANFWK